jgi:UDP-3-O-[3-hydroxymyristoyl] glucosamine N-acyltransferase
MRLAELAVRFGCELRGDPEVVVERVGTLQHAGPGQLAFLANPQYRRHLSATRASAVVLHPSAADECPTAALLHENPYATYARIAQVLHPPERGPAGVHASAVVADGVRLASTASVGAGAFIGPGCVVEDGVEIGPGCILLGGVTIGPDSQLVARVTLGRGVRVGSRCILHPGSVIGADGFGHARDGQQYVKVPQVGSVVLGDDVEIGANTTIDRGAIDDTCLDDGVKIDNLVQIGHNVRIGAHTVIAGCTGVSGSTTIGKRCVIGGMVAFAGHLQICDDAIITGRTTVIGSIRTPGMYSSALPEEPTPRFRRNAARFQRLDEYVQRLREIERRLGIKTKKVGDDGA